MKHFNSLNNNRVISCNSTHCINIYRSLFVFVIIIAASILPEKAFSQTVTHPASEVTTSAKFYKYRHNISASNFKDIGYVLVRSANGDIKSAFNACDVCYPANKGYSQSGTKLRCNNCGKTFEIDKLGTQTPGGCWPSHLPNSVNGGDVVLTVPELVKGEYLFPVQVASEVSDNQPLLYTTQLIGNSILNIKAFAQNINSVRIISITGMLCKVQDVNLTEFNIDVSNLLSGAYILMADINGKPVSNIFYIVR
jgi:hypothetical protein